MEDSEHRALWGALGVALLIAGVVTLSDWTFVAVAAPPSRDLTALWWPWVGAFFMMGLGIYALVAVSNEKLWIPGRKTQKARRDKIVYARSMLSSFQVRGSRMSIDPTGTFEQYTAWDDALRDFVEAAWGRDQSVALLPPQHMGSVMEGFQQITTLVTRLIERVPLLTIRDDFNPLNEPAPDWYSYWEIPLPQDEEEPQGSV